MGVKYYIKFVQELWQSDSEYKYYTTSFVFLKTTVYTFLMWFPIYLVSKNLGSFSGYITMLFDIGGVLGGYYMGKLYTQYHQQAGKAKHKQK
jgi:hypothetical protein